MKNFDRVQKLERNVESLVNNKNPCYAFFTDGNKSDDEAITVIEELFNMKISRNEFRKWRRIHQEDGLLLITSPNFNIDKYIVQLA